MSGIIDELAPDVADVFAQAERVAVEVNAYLAVMDHGPFSLTIGLGVFVLGIDRREQIIGYAAALGVEVTFR
ncbi:hypothetical protein [Catenuloplanes japonicus]|uniref:hypothetical protein n=1 Tax=Catenuloplanes japonicus TaxID=33876 RepID=UPI000525C021|nr:hypothetical protein [Catenuloplanes japonicus]